MFMTLNNKVYSIKWYILIRSTLKSGEIYFKLNEEFDEETLDGRDCKVADFKLKKYFSLL